MNSITSRIADTRAHLAALHAQQTAPTSTQASRAEAQAALVDQIDTWHAHAAERIGEDLQRMAAGGSVDLLAPADNYGFPIPADVRLIEQAKDTRAWITFALGKSELLKRFKPLLDQMPEGLDAPARAKHKADIESQIVQAEVLEESLIREAEAQGLSIDPRPGQRAEAAILIGFGRT